MSKKNNQTFSQWLISLYFLQCPGPSSFSLPSLLALHGAPAGGVGTWASLLDQPMSFPNKWVLFLS